MAAYDLYGVKGLSISNAKSSVEVALKLCFEERESLYQGGIYFICGDETSESYMLKGNIDLLDEEAAEPEFSDYPVLLYVNITARSEQIAMLLGERFHLLKHEYLD